MAQKRIVEIKGGVEIYKKSKSYTDAELSSKLTNKLGVANGIATLGNDGKIPSTQLPSGVDDVIDSYVVSGATALSAGWLSRTSGGSALTPETDKIYVVISAGAYQNRTYRWSGTTYVEISESLALGETSSTAYRGDRGKVAYEHSQDATRTGSAKSKKLYKVAITQQGHISEEEEVVKKDLTDLGVEDASNKTTTIRSTGADDTKYPTEKAVRTEADKKADKVAGATDGHLASLDGNGNLNDSGKSLSDLAGKIIVGDNTSTTDTITETQDPYLYFRQDGANKSSHRIKGGTNISVKYKPGEGIVIENTYTPEAHHQAKNVVSGSASGKVNTEVSTNGEVHLNLVENDTVRSHIIIEGDGDVVEVKARTDDGEPVIEINGNAATAAQMAAAIDAYENGFGSTPAGDAAVDAYIASLG